MTGKTHREAALQEAFEEAGLCGLGSYLPLGSYRLNKRMSDGADLPCTVSVYGMSQVTELDAWPEMKDRERRWASQAEAVEMAFDRNLARFLANITADRLWSPTVYDMSLSK